MAFQTKSYFQLLFALILSNVICIDYDVLIIGAGPAGISAAIELKKLKPNINMKIIEARNRIGGRVFTDVDTFEDDVSADLGAQWIHAYGPKNPIYSWHRLLQTEEEKEEDAIFDFFTPSVTGCYDVNGLTVSRQTCKQARKLMEKLFSPAYNRTLDRIDLSVQDMINPQYNKIPEGSLKRIVQAMIIGREENEGADLANISARQTFFAESSGDDEVEEGEDMSLINGYGTLINRIATFNKLTFDLNTVVTRISTSNKNYVEVSTSNNRTFRSKTALITVPLGCLKKRSITFEPALPQWKLQAIDSMGFGDTDKIILQFDRVFWDPKWTTFFIGGSSFPFAICFPNKRALAFMVGGVRAENMEANADLDTIRTILRDLRAAFPTANYSLLRWKITRWSQDPFARGSYSYFALNTTIATIKTLARQCCENRLFWGGEHTRNGGSVHTAFITGQREAKKIIQRIR